MGDTAQSNAIDQGRFGWVARARILWRHRLRRMLPRLVWIGDEIDVCITFTEDKLPLIERPDAESAISAGLQYLNSGALAKLETLLEELGIEFDRDAGPDGRDWEWDWSLSGPISVQFRGRAQRPEQRY
jgi:hypothetical protein